MKQQEIKQLQERALEAYRNALLRRVQTKDAYTTALAVYTELVAIKPRLIDMYRCAKLLENAECFDVPEPAKQWRQACQIYDRMLITLEKDKRHKDPALYERICYRLCRTALRIVTVTDVLREEESILWTKYQAMIQSERAMFYKAVQAMERLQEHSRLAAHVAQLQDLRDIRTHWLFPQDIYYMRGKLYDIAGQQGYLPMAEAFGQAAKYYEYAQYLTDYYSAGKASSPALTQALLTVYMRLRQGTTYQAMYDRAVESGGIPRGFIYICRMRQALIREEYDDVQAEMTRYVKKNHPLPGFSLRRARAFMTLAQQGHQKQIELPFY